MIQVIKDSEVAILISGIYTFVSDIADKIIEKIKVMDYRILILITGFLTFTFISYLILRLIVMDIQKDEFKIDPEFVLYFDFKTEPKISSKLMLFFISPFVLAYVLYNRVSSYSNEQSPFKNSDNYARALDIAFETFLVILALFVIWVIYQALTFGLSSLLDITSLGLFALVLFYYQIYFFLNTLFYVRLEKQNKAAYHFETYVQPAPYKL
jgi:hypothetical protein